MSDSTLKPPGSAPSKLQLGVPVTQTPPASSSGSATGNPRNKCALKPGYSLMNWVRLCNSGADLSGTGGRVVPVSSEELARHNKVDDAWMAIRGKVFNVTRYMDFHPGGVDELMRGVGRDATKLFDEVHAWVNYPQLLRKCYVGPLKYAVRVDSDLRRTLLESQQSLGKPPKPTAPLELLPRFDWIQQRSELTLFIYTRQFANPGVLLKLKTPQSLELRVQLAHNWHVLDFDLAGIVEWPPKVVRIGSETGKIEIILCKQEPAPWTTYGTHKITKLNALDAQEERYDFKVQQLSDFNHDSFELILESTQPQVAMVPPIGYHVAIETSIDGEVIQRSYTPVAQTYLKSKSFTQTTALGFLIKRYDQGQMSRKLCQLTKGAIVQLSLPRGNFQLEKLSAHRNILLLAAGSGLTPILSLLEPLLRRNANRLERLSLLYFNKTEADIWLQDALQVLHTADERFTYTSLLSKGEQAQQRISLELMSPLLEKKDPECFSFVAICGPNDFNAAAVNILKELQFKLDQVHVFQG